MSEMPSHLPGVLWALAKLAGPEKPGGPQRFLKESSIHAFFYLASHHKALPYDTAPVLSNWHGDVRYVQLSQEGLEDLSELEQRNLVERLELTSMENGFLSAYRINKAGREIAERATAEEQARLAPLVQHRCGTVFEYRTGPEGARQCCPHCGSCEPIDCLRFPVESYGSEPYYPQLLKLTFAEDDGQGVG